MNIIYKKTTKKPFGFSIFEDLLYVVNTAYDKVLKKFNNI